MKYLYDNLRTCPNLVADVLEFVTQRRKEAGRNKHTDLLTPDGVRDLDYVSRVSGEQIRVSIPRRRGPMWYTLLN